MSGKPRWTDAFLLALLSSVGPFAANAYMPGFLLMADDFGVPLLAVQQSLSVYLVAFAVSSLLVGGLSDALGRRVVILGGTLLFAAAAVGAMLAPNLETLLFFRILQGLCAAVGPVVTMAVVRDRWDGNDAARLLALIALLFSLAPALAPVTGGWLATHFGWRSVFLFLTGFNLLIAASAFFFLPESLPKERRRTFSLGGMLPVYGRALRHRAFTAGVVGHGICFLGGILYSAGAADFVLRIMRMTPNDFAWFMFPLIGASMFGAALAPKLLTRFGSKALVLGSGILMALSGFFGAVLDWEGASPYPLILLAPTVYSFGMAVARPAMNVLNLDYFPDARGAAASVQQFFQTSAFAVSSAFVVPVVLGDSARYSLVMALCGVLVFILWRSVFAERERLKMPTE